MSDGIAAMEFLAMKLSDKEISARDQRARTSTVSAERRAEERAEAARIRDAAIDNFLNKSGIAFSGWTGMSVGGSGVSADGSTIDAFRGGAGVELRLYNIGIQTGINVIADNMPVPGAAEEHAALTTAQMPILLHYFLGNRGVKGESNIGLTAFGGVGLNLFTGTSDTVSVDPAALSFIAGGGLRWYGYHFNLFLGYQYNGDIDTSSLAAAGGGLSDTYTRNVHLMTLGIAWHIPFRQSQ
jgi:hypothetical protein